MTRTYDRTPGLSSNSGEFRFGMRVTAALDLTINGVWWYWLTGGPTTVDVHLYVSGAEVASGSKASDWAAGWNLVSFDSTYVLAAPGTAHAYAHINDGNYGYDSDVLPRDFDTADDGDIIEGTFEGGSGGEPGSTWTGVHGVDVDYDLFDDELVEPVGRTTPITSQASAEHVAWTRPTLIVSQTRGGPL